MLDDFDKFRSLGGPYSGEFVISKTANIYEFIFSDPHCSTLMVSKTFPMQDVMCTLFDSVMGHDICTNNLPFSFYKRAYVFPATSQDHVGVNGRENGTSLLLVKHMP